MPGRAREGGGCSARAGMLLADATVMPLHGAAAKRSLEAAGYEVLE